MSSRPAQPLTPFYRELAKKEVGENDKHVAAHLVSFKRWLAACPHLKIPQNDTFLLSFLRYAHYDHSTAQRRIDNFCTLRCSDKITSRWYNYPPLDDPVIDQYLNSGLFIPLGFLKSGVYVILLRLAAWSATEMDNIVARTLNNMSYERLILDERCQIGGFCLFIDLNQISLEQARQWGDVKNTGAAFRLMQQASPGRTKLIVFYNESKIFDVLFKMIEVLLSEKMKKRIIRVKDDIYKSFKKVKGLEEILPTEYNGFNGTLEEAIRRNRSEFLEFYSNGYPLKDIEVDECKRPASAQNYLIEYKGLETSVLGSSGTYVKLDPQD